MPLCHVSCEQFDQLNLYLPDATKYIQRVAMGV